MSDGEPDGPRKAYGLAIATTRWLSTRKLDRLRRSLL